MQFSTIIYAANSGARFIKCCKLTIITNQNDKQ